MDEQTLARVRSPAGSVRGASQAEIALLAMAEVVTARHRRGPRPVESEPALGQFATDPVCGMTVEVGTARQADHAGSTFWFCCPGCRQQFVAEPERYRQG